MPETSIYSVVCAIQNLWLAARTEGIGVGWVSILDPAAVKELLRIPPAAQLVAYLCLGYVEGVADAGEQQALVGANATGASTLGIWRWCIPTGAASVQARDIVVNFLRENPAQRHLAAASVVALALQHAWPCRP